MNATLRTLLGLLLISWTPLSISAEGIIRLSNPEQTVIINPSTLSVEATFPNSERLTLSQPRDTRSAVAQLEFGEHAATWRLPDLELSVSCRLEGTELSVHFLSDREQSLTWPIIEPAAQVQGYVIPHSCGRYIPPRDTTWQDFLADRSFKATELSMPFWGLHCEKRTLTYILTNPFNTDLRYGTKDGALTLQVAHRFTKKQKKKLVGIQIVSFILIVLF